MIPVVDIFAGPGGLGEGFSQVTDKNTGERYFKIALSVEKDKYAYQTLLVRSFFRQFETPEQVPDDYYQYLRGEITQEALFESYPNEAKSAKEEALHYNIGKDPDGFLDEKIQNAIKGNRNWILIGGPPCQAYSIIGRSRKRGIDPDDEKVFLYRQYYRLLAHHNPPFFIMENVKGLISAKLENSNILDQILNDLKDPQEAYFQLHGKKDFPAKCPGYRIYSLVKSPHGYDIEGNPVYDNRDFIIESEKYGIPQTRHRIILLGIRKDINKYPEEVLETKDSISVHEVLKDLPKIRSGISKSIDSEEEWNENLKNFVKRNYSNFDSNIINKMIYHINNGNYSLKKGDIFVKCSNNKKIYNEKWFKDRRLNGTINHKARSHIKKDILRYFYASVFAEIYKRSPKINDFPKELHPDHKNIIKENKYEYFADRFRVQLKDQPSKTITSHISKDGHYYIHYDPQQSRSLTVREAARIQTFPDNYLFLGPRTQQYIQVGNAVPTLLSKKIALFLKKYIL